MRSGDATNILQPTADEFRESSSDEDDFSNFINDIEVSAKKILGKNHERNKGRKLQNQSCESIYSPSNKKHLIPNRIQEKSTSFMFDEQKMQDGTKEKIKSQPHRISRSRDKNRRRKRKENIRSTLHSASHADIIELKGSVLKVKYRNEELSSEREEKKNLDRAIGKENGKSHPIHSLIEEHILLANKRARLRTSKMLQSKKCDLNVHDSWTSNMENLNALIDHPDNKDDNVLPTKIDLEQIKNGESQIQSVGISVATASFGKRMSGDVLKNDLTTRPNSGKVTLCPLVVFERVVIKVNGGFEKSLNVSVDALIAKDSFAANRTPTWEIKLFNSSYELEETILLPSDKHKLVTSVVRQRLTKLPTIEGDLVYKQAFAKTLGSVVIKGESSVQIRCTGIKIVAVITFILHENISGYEGKLPLSLSLQVPTYEIIARMHKYHKCKAFDGPFWKLRTNGDLIWTPLVSMIDFFIIEGKHSSLSWKWNSSNEPKKSEDLYDEVRLAHELLIGLNEEETTLRDIVFSTDSSEKNQALQALIPHDEPNDSSPSLSLRLIDQGAISSTGLCPGFSIMGKRGEWYHNNGSSQDSSRDSMACLSKAQPVASFMKKSVKGQIPKAIVTTSIALDGPILAPLYVIYDPKQMIPSPSKDDLLDGKIPLSMSPCYSLFDSHLKSEIDIRMPSTIMTLDKAAKKEDWEGKAKPCVVNHEKQKYNDHFFRVKCWAENMCYDTKITPRIFGITEEGASPNKTAVNRRESWHSTDVCIDLLSNKRGSEDFHHLLEHKFSDRNGGYPGDAILLTLHMRAYAAHTIESLEVGKYLILQKDKLKLECEKRQKLSLNVKIRAASELLDDKVKADLGINFEPLKDLREEPKDFQPRDEMADIMREDDSAIEQKNNQPLNDHIATLTPPHDSHQISKSIKGYGWRKIPHSICGVDMFMSRKHKVQSCFKGLLFDKCNQIKPALVVEASKCVPYSINGEQFQTQMQSHIIKDLTIERIQYAQGIDESRNSNQIILSANQQGALEHILKVPLDNSETKYKAIVENLKIDKQGIENGIENGDTLAQEGRQTHHTSISSATNMAEMESRAILAVRNANYNALEELLDEMALDIDTRDNHGNSLLIIASQQGDKKLCKFLLRRGAHINAQNHAGNTVLHYLRQYGHHSLGDYLMRKGADDTYLNADGLTCYEGLNKQSLEQL